MTELKYGGSDVKIMYGSQEIGGATKLEPGTVLYIGNYMGNSFEDVHLLNTTKNWSNIDGIKIAKVGAVPNDAIYEVDIFGDDFKSLDIKKTYSMGPESVTVSRSTVDGEYRLNGSGYRSQYTIVITAL